MQILEFNKEHTEQVKDLLVQLQEYIVTLDKNKLNIITPQYREMYFKKTLKDIRKNKGKMFVAVDNTNVVGFVCGYIETYTKWDKIDYVCPKKGVITELVVDKNIRGGGVGKQLMQQMEDYFKSLKCEYVLLQVFAQNQGGKNFYDKLGYENSLINMLKKL